MTRRRWVVGLVALVVLASVAGAIWTGLDVRRMQHDHDADRAALDAGRTAALAFTSYDYTHLDQDLDRVTEMSTGKFRDQFTSALGALTAAIKKAQGVSAGRVTYAGLETREGDTATVMAAVDATITNTTTTKPAIRRYRLKITLNRDSGSWLIADISPVA